MVDSRTYYAFEKNWYGVFTSSRLRPLTLLRLQAAIETVTEILDRTSRVRVGQNMAGSRFQGYVTAISYLG